MGEWMGTKIKVNEGSESCVPFSTPTPARFQLKTSMVFRKGEKVTASYKFPLSGSFHTGFLALFSVHNIKIPFFSPCDCSKVVHINYLTVIVLDCRHHHL